MRHRQAVLVLLSLDRARVVRLLSCFSDATVESLGREMMEIDPSSISTDETDRAMRTLLEQTGDTSARATSCSELTQVVTSPECMVLAACLAQEKLPIAALLLHRFPLCITTRTLLAMSRAARDPLMQRVRRLRDTPRELQARIFVDFLRRIPRRPFPALPERLARAIADREPAPIAVRSATRPLW